MDKIVKKLRSRIDKQDKAVLARIEKGEAMDSNDQTALLMKDLLWQDRFLHAMYDMAALIPALTEKQMEKLLEVMVRVVTVDASEFAAPEIYPIALDLVNGQLLDAFTNIGTRICALPDTPDPAEAANIIGDSIDLILVLHDRATKRFLKKNTANSEPTAA